MESDSKSLLLEVFLEAAKMDDSRARAAYLDQACGDNLELRQRVERLLAAEARAGGPPPQAPPSAQTGGDPALGSRIGRYKLIQQIGEGGCGVVFMAEQEQPVRRKVALKVIKLGMDTKRVVARFEAERQALALMDHPNIAQVFDAGATESGRPYFVMELVRGIEITDYCNQYQLPTRQRLDLFIQVCHAVQHAHQKGVIHRDLKPSNILVTELDGVPLPKIIDFGIAKAVEGRLTDQTLFTAFEQFIGTPAYMSPEQAALTATDIDTRSDIYSLGVLLYELLAGKTPFDTKALLASGLDAMRQTIREKEPLRPSTRLRALRGEELTTTARSRGTEVPRLVHLIRGDLDWIVMKCLEKDRKRRYETANGLAEDLQRHLDNEPVLARPPSRLYEFQKSVRRHKVGFAATATVILVLLAGVLASSWEAARATHAEKKALAAQASETKLRQQAQAQELVARQRAYLADMRTLGESLDHNLARARRLLNDYQPRPGEEDLRDFEWYYFKRVLSENESEVLGTHPGGALTLLMEPDGTFIAAGQRWALAAGDLQIWDGPQGKLKSSFSVPKSAIGIALSHDGRRLAIARGLDIEIRSMDQPDQVQTVLTNWHHGLMHDAWTMAMCFVDDDTQLAVGDWSANFSDTSLPLTFVQIASDQTNQFLPFVPPLGLDGLAVSRDGRRLAVKDSNGRILVLDFPGARPVGSIQTQDTWWLGVYPAMTFLNDPARLVTTSDSGQIDVWNLATTNRRTIGNHGSFVTALALSPDGKRLASVGLDQTIKIWDPQVERPPLRVLRGHTDLIFAVGFLPDGHTLVSCGRDQTVRRWDLRKPEPLKAEWRLPFGQKYAVIRYGILAATDWSEHGQGWKVWDVSRLSESGEPRPISPPLSMKGALVVPLHDTDYHLVWFKPNTDWDQLHLYRGLAPPEPVAGFPKIRTSGDRAIHFKNPLLMIHGASNGVPYDLVWDLTHSRKVHLVKSPMLEVTAVAFASDGSFVLLGNGHRFEKLDLATGVSDAWNDAAPTMLSTLAILPDNRTVLAGGGLGGLRKLDFGTRRIVKEVIGSPMLIESMCLSPSGTRLATGDLGGHVRLWDVQTLREVAQLGTHPGAVTGLYFTPDGRNLLSVDATELRVWRTADH